MKNHVERVVAIALTLLATARAESSVGIQILSATVRDEKVVGATVIMQKDGAQSVTAVTNAQGQVQLDGSFADDRSALLIVRKAGYSDLVVKCPCAGLTYAVSPVMETLDGLRVVLNWGAAPRDLDGHLTFPLNHVYFFHKSGTDAQQDIDHTDGFGPETITVTRKHSGERYVYAVHDYTDKESPDSESLSASDAKVFVYIGQTLIHAYYVPKHRAGNVWTVFAVSETGELQDINTLTGVRFGQVSVNAATEENFFGSQSAATRAPTAPPATVVPVPEGARKLNTQGESAYRAGDYSAALRLFRAAIEQDDTYGQAYSNLGLVFRKSGRVAEALWADRKAIALAHGPSAATTRANTHYNNGKIYEEARQWDDALREFLAAEGEKSGAVYEEAILRMHGQGAR